MDKDLDEILEDALVPEDEAKTLVRLLHEKVNLKDHVLMSEEEKDIPSPPSLSSTSPPFAAISPRILHENVNLEDHVLTSEEEKDIPSAPPLSSTSQPVLQFAQQLENPSKGYMDWVMCTPSNLVYDEGSDVKPHKETEVSSQDLPTTVFVVEVPSVFPNVKMINGKDMSPLWDFIFTHNWLGPSSVSAFFVVYSQNYCKPINFRAGHMTKEEFVELDKVKPSPPPKGGGIFELFRGGKADEDKVSAAAKAVNIAMKIKDKYVLGPVIFIKTVPDMLPSDAKQALQTLMKKTNICSCVSYISPQGQVDTELSAMLLKNGGKVELDKNIVDMVLGFRKQHGMAGLIGYDVEVIITNDDRSVELYGPGGQRGHTL